jgi:hypothetical protein
MDALDLAILIEEEAHQRYKMFAAQVGGGGSSYDAASFFASMAENEAKHGNELLARRIEMFGKVPMNVKLVDLYDVEAPDTGAPRRGMSTIQAFRGQDTVYRASRRRDRTRRDAAGGDGQTARERQRRDSK